MNKPLLSLVLIAFGALTAYTMVYYGGLIPWLTFYTRDPASWQVCADLVIVMCLLLVFVKRDAEATGRPFWPWAIFSLMVGSFGPLLYFLTRKAWLAPHPEWRGGLRPAATKTAAPTR